MDSKKIENNNKKEENDRNIKDEENKKVDEGKDSQKSSEEKGSQKSNYSDIFHININNNEKEESALKIKMGDYNNLAKKARETQLKNISSSSSSENIIIDKKIIYNSEGKFILFI